MSYCKKTSMIGDKVVLRVGGGWSEEIRSALVAGDFDVLEVGEGMEGSFAGFEPYADQIRWLSGRSVPDNALEGVSSGLEKLSSIERIDSHRSVPSPLFDYRKLPRLRIFTCGDAARINPLYLNHPNMQALDLERLKSPDLSFLSETEKLQALRLVGGPLKSVEGLGGYAELRELRLLQTRGLTNISALARAVNLEALELDSTPKLTDVAAIYGLSKLRWLFVDARNAKQNDFSWLLNMPRLECASILVETSEIDWDIFARLTRLYHVGFFTHKGYIAESDAELITRLSAHGKQVKAITRFPKDVFPAFSIEFVPPSDIPNAMPKHVYQNHLRYVPD